MLEGLATWFLNNYLGKYLQNLNTDQLSDALRFLNSSLEVRSGLVGKISLRIPVSRIRSERWSISLEQVYIVTGPQRFETFDPSQDDQLNQELKLSALDGIEAEWRVQHDHQRTGGNYYPSYSSWMSYGTSFIGNIVENLQIQIRDVHIRYEDDISCPERPFACGFHLGSLSAQACDENGVPKFVHRDPRSAMALKLVELNDMSAYLISLTQRSDLYGNLSPEAMKEKMGFNPNSTHEFILNPVSAQAKLKRDCSERPLNSRKTPRVVCDLELDCIPLEITDEQYQCLITGGRSLHQLHKNRLFWKWRPCEPVHNHAGIWWRYAIACHMERIRDRNHVAQWSTVLEKASENVLYVEAFKSYLVNPVNLSAELKAVKDEQDEKRSFEELKALRNLAVFQLKQMTGGLDERPGSRDDNFFVDDDSPEEPIAQAPSLLQQYFPSWYSSSEAADTEITEKVDESIRSSHAAGLDASISPLEEEFIEGLADDIHIVPYKDLIFAQINFVLKRGSFKLFSKRSIYESLPRHDEKGNHLLFELEFNTVKLNCETRPRTRSYKFALSLGGMYLRDMITKESIFPLLISPLNEEGAPLNSRASTCLRNFEGIAKSFQSFLPKSASKATQETPLFLFHYETRPFGTKKVDGKLHISSQPLNIVYNPAVLYCLSEFFKIPDELNRSAQLSAKLRSAAYIRIEEAKQKTKEEFLKSLHSILDGHNSGRRNWDILCELSAPQIIIPEHFVNKEALIMVIDLGKFHFSNDKGPQGGMSDKSAPEDQVKANEGEDEEDEEFCTPASSPGSPLQQPAKASTEQDFNKLDPDLMESTVMSKMYDRFTMSMKGMQVIIGRVKDNWRSAHLRGSSLLHVLDKFSISLMIDIRVVAANDPQMPSFVISGTLPKLNMHVNEDKIHSLERMTRLLILGDAEQEETSKMSAACQTDDLLDTPMSSPNEEEEIGNLFSDWNSKTSEVNPASTLLLIQFCVSDLAVELQSQGKSIVELQVTGVKACLTKRPFDTNITLSVMSLLVVDALQTFGRDFELLVASHRHVMVDSLSGSLRGSEPVSPMSPSSPDPHHRSLEESALDIKRVLSSLQSRDKRATSPPVKYPHSPRHMTSPPSFVSPHSNRRQVHCSPSSVGLETSTEAEALIMVDILIISPNCPNIDPDEYGNRERHQIVSIHFNSLDVIANQETIIELLAFFKRVLPSVGRPSRNRRTVPTTSDCACQTEGSVNRFGSLTCLDSTNPSKTATISAFSTPNIFHESNAFESSKIETRLELRADFQRLNILLLRAKTGKRIGTFLLTEASIHSVLSKAINVSGSLGGMQVMNLLSGSTLHQKIISVGKDPMIDDSNKGFIHAQIYALGEGNEEKKALTFSISQRTDCASGFQSYLGTPMKESTSFQATNSMASDRLNIDLNIKMAAVCYVHSASFLNELNSCATDFKLYISNLAHSIRMAATEIALGIVHRRSEAISHQATMDEYFGTLPKAKGGASFQAPDYYPSLERGARITAPAPTPRHESKANYEFDLHLDMVMESPVIVIPRQEWSFEVLVAHLGEISVSNEIIQGYALQDEVGLPHDTQRADRVEVTVTDMSLHSLNLTEKYARYAKDPLNLLSQFRHLLAQELYACKSKGALPIWHDTAIDLRIDRIERFNSKMPESESFQSFQFHGSEHFSESGFRNNSSSESVFHVKGKVTNPLKLSLYRSQYELLQDGVKNMAPPEQISDPEADLDDSEIPRKPSFNIGLDPPSGNAEEPSEIEGSFEVPQLILELRGDLVNSISEGDTLVRLKFQDFAVFYDKTELYKNSIEIALKSVLMEDLQLDEGSKHRFLMSSSFKDQSQTNYRGFSRPDYGLSTSCPDFWFHNDIHTHGTSLPDNLDPKVVIGAEKPHPKMKHRKRPQNLKIENDNPLTPPPSAVSSKNSPIFNDFIKRDLQNEDNLIHIKVLNIDKRGPDYYKKYKCTNRFVDVNFNTLDIIFNLETWVMVLDFFGIGAGPSKDTSSAPPITRRAQEYERSKRTKESNTTLEEDFNMEINIKVIHLSLILNKPEYEVASAGVRNFVSCLYFRDGNFSIDGKLEQFSLKDLTPHNSRYKDRFLSRGGEQVLTFHFFKYTQDDEKLSRPYDASLKLRMASVTYVHTHRFYSEILVFFNQFHVHQSVMNSMRDVAAGGAVKDLAGRGTRIKLDIEAGSPLILLPMSSSSSKILSVDLGFLEIRNTFKFSGEEGTISRETLASCTSHEVLGRRSRGTSKTSRSTARSPDSSGGRSANSPLRRRRPSSRQRRKDEESSAQMKVKKCLLDVMNVHMRKATLRTAERLSAFTDDDALAKEDILVGSFIVRPQSKPLLKETFELKLQVERNLDKAFSHRVPDTSVKGVLSKLHLAVDQDQYTMIRGLLAYNFGEPLDDLNFETAASEQIHPLSGQTWTGMFMEFELQDVILDLLQHHGNPSRSVQESGLARVSFIQSRLIFEGSSDSTTDVDLVSQEILLSDLRFADYPANKKSNVFSKILYPMEVVERRNPMQAEVHFRATPNFNQFTVLLNNMRLMCIFDWWIKVLDFISKSTQNPRTFLEERNPESNEVTVTSSQPTISRSFLDQEPIYPTAGVISRRAPIVDCSGPVFELKLNITESETIIVADSSKSDTSTVILRSTTVVTYRPDMVNRPFSCNLNNAEVFSCILGREEESSLSIIDPVTINLDIGARNGGAGTSKGLADFTGSVGDERTAEVHLQQINIRLSYNDWLMFMAIMDSFPKQAREAIYGKQESRRDGSNDTEPFFHEPMNVQSQIHQLANLGFRREDCATALKAKRGQLNEAALWLIENASSDSGSKRKFPDHSSKSSTEASNDVSSYLDGSPISFSSFELKASSVNICIIDDCKDADVPLLETTLRQLHLTHGFAGKGKASTQVSGSYYNRALSAWEPFLEPWAAQLTWELKRVGTNGQKLAMHMTTSDSINFNLTSTLVDLYQVVKENWTEDLQKANSRLENLKARGPESRHRMAFVPYALINNTGSVLWFCTQARNTGTQFGANQSRVSRGFEAKWIQVEPGETAQFTFENRGKLRHTHTHDVKIHQVIIKVHGWLEISPVSVDRVGTYFRKAKPIPAADSDEDLPPARIVCDVRLEGSARKLIAVRSALQVANVLPHPMDLKLETSLSKSNDVLEIQLHPGEIRPIPLTYVWSRIYAKPSTGNVSQWQYCEEPVNWFKIMTKQDNSLDVRTSSKVWRQHSEKYRFCVAIERENYPIENTIRRTSEERIAPAPSSWIQPAHKISFVSPIVVVNLLPCHLMLKNMVGNLVKSNIAPGKEHFLPVDISQQIVLHLSLDQYPKGSDLIVPPNSCNFEARIKLTDQEDRPLFLQVRVIMVYHGAVKISVYAPIWLVNKTGIPLIFKQEGSSSEAAGQDVEHEVGRMGAPLLFSFLEREGNHAIMIRVGKDLHPQGKTTWCKHFYIQLGARVRKLRVIPPDQRAEWVYIIGIEVRLGKGRYRDTFIVTLAPRFQIHNQTQYTILLAQKRYAATFTDLEAKATHLEAMPNATLSFHWPRLDMEQLLCIRLIEMKDGQWSGGFFIEGVNSFHVSIRDNNNLCVFIRVEIGLIGATYSIIFADSGNFPPPFRIDNFSEVSITYYQNGIHGQGMHQCAKPRHSLPYAWDEPTLPPELTIVPPGGVTYNFNMNLIGNGCQVTYENFIYIAMSGTFQKSPRNPRSTDGSDVESMELVLDVEGTKVILAKKEAGKRSQLWRMTSQGLLQHEGSSAPQDPKKSPEVTMRNILVLDISGHAVQPKHCVPLMLRKPDERRKLTQYWRFTKDGRMMCDHHGLYVQAQDGFLGLQQGNNVVLGPPSSVCYTRNPNGIPLEQAIDRHRLRPGSGFLSVKVTTDGPTRVLEITDEKQNRVYAQLEERDWQLIQENERPTLIVPGNIPRKDSRQEASQGREFQIVIEAKKGVGLSLVCRNPPEELLYAFMTNVVVDYQSSCLQTVLDGSVQHIQIDNQLHSAQIPILLYLSPMSKNDDHRHLPAIHFTSKKSLSKTENAVIYKHLMVTVRNMTINLEEELLCRVLKFAGITRSDLEMERLDESASEAQRALIASTTSATRYYFGTLKLALNQVKLSVIKSNKLAPDLQAVKRKLGLSLITFEDANIELDPFVLVHPFETINFLTNRVIKHYQDELLSQAVLILGSTDFLGNPLGFLNDLTEGVSGLVIDGNVTGLIRNVAHGAANSAAKVTGTLSSGLSRVTLEERYDERRLMIRRKKGERGKEHLVAGLKGFGFGMLGGLTSVVTETYDGVANDGITGLFTGLGWGLIGTISKPAIGVLDLATGAATAVRESSKSAFKQLPPKIRPARVVVGPGGSMPVYSEFDAQGQELMYRLCLNGRDDFETYVAHQILTPGDEDLQIMITSDRVIVFSCPGNSRDAKILLIVSLSQLCHARAVVETKDTKDKHYIEMKIANQTIDPSESMFMDDGDSKRPQVFCASDKLAAAVSQQINYAKVMFEERIQAVIEDVNLDEQ
ncbi:hypothetical protein TCAL_03981 [Tigriopus californicus]|uniref:UBA domain-containing protein n=1 Tax=Tigriopus californicus TaxID=6832 RepID=A0A553NC18_TIGCA|nr:hypothetical protein TCAL_03981 [Tigriopus californicus]